LGLLILPIAIASELAGKVGLAQSMGVAAIGFVLFTLGRAIQIRSGHGSA
jgi:hypothetical protein